MIVRKTARVLSADIDVLTWDSMLSRVALWAGNRESRYICICNVHSVVTAGLDKAFGAAVHGADLATPDGAPVAWMLRRITGGDQQRINGPDLMLKYCALAESKNESIFLYGSTNDTLEVLVRRLSEVFPALKIAGAYSPPFRPLTLDEDLHIVDMINASGAGTVWVGLGCPKQELWMAEHKGRVHSVMIGVGAAFEYHGRTVRRAPVWMQRHGLEWFYRLVSEPRRLWRRYFFTNSLFILGVAHYFLCNTFGAKKK